MWKELPHERGIDISYETVRFWWNRFGPTFAVEIPLFHGSCPLLYFSSFSQVGGIG
jgi:hypothetical protein